MAQLEPKRMKRITILGSNSGRNAGDAAILASIMRILTEKLGPDTIFEVPSTNPKFIKSQYGSKFNVKPISIMPWTASVRLLGLPTFRSVKRSDMTLITDGIIFDVKLFNPLFNFLITLIFIAPWAKLWGRPLVCFNVGIGPLESFWGKRFGRFVGNACDLITVRDQESHDLFRQVGVIRDIHLTGDSAFLNWGISKEKVYDHLKFKQISEPAKEGRLLGVNVTPYVDRWLRKDEKVEERASFLPTLAQALVRLKCEKNLEPVIFTTQVMDAAYGSALSEQVSKLYHQQTGDSWRPALFANVDLNNHELMSLAGICRLFLGMRYHSLILASKAGAPVMGLIYAPKVRSFMAQVGTPEFGIELAKASSDSLFETVALALERQDTVRQKQQAVVNNLCQGAERAADLLRERYYSQEERLVTSPPKLSKVAP